MASLTPTTALGAAAPFDQTIGTIRIIEVADPQMASLAMRRGKGAAFEKAASAHLGPLPDPGQSHAKGKARTLWMGPDQYLVEDMDAAKLASAFGGSAAVTDQSDAWARFDIGGQDVLAMLERLSNTDSRRMQDGAVTRTAIHHMHCVIICRAADTHFTILGPRSSAASLHHALVAAAASL